MNLKEEWIGRMRSDWGRIMTGFYVLLLLNVALLPTAHAEQAAAQDFGSGGLFSYVPPDGWKVSEVPGLKYKVCLGNPAKGFAPNIVVVEEAYEKSLDDYVKANIAMMQKVFQDHKILSQTDFTTSGGARAVKMITEREDPQLKKRLRQIYYFFDAGNKKFS